MKAIQRFPLDCLARIEIDALDDVCTWHYKSLAAEVEKTVQYHDIERPPDRVKRGEPGASNASLFFFVVSIIFLLVNSFIIRFSYIWLWIPLFCAASLMLVAFFAQFRKQEFIYFEDCHGTSFFINADKNPDLANYLLSRIQSTEVPSQKSSDQESVQC